MDLSEPPRDLRVQSVVRLTRPVVGMACGSEGILVGWYMRDDPTALVRFWDGGPLEVPADSIEPASP